MPLYLWRGINQLGQSAKGITQASTPDQLKELLLDQNIALLDHHQQQSGDSWITRSFQRRIHTRQLSDFFERLSLLISNGVELVHALEVLTRLTPHQEFSNIIQQMTQAIGQGQSFHSALQAYPHVFSPFIIQVIEVGEKTGKLGLVLENLKDALAQQLWLQKHLKQAALAPAITLTVAALLIGGILVFILPHFQSLYQSLGSALPPATQLLLTFQQNLCSWYGLAWFLALIACIATFKALLKNLTIKRWVQALCLHLPIIRRIVITSNLISFTQILSLFLTSGLPLTQALEHIWHSAQNLIFKAEVEKILSSILEGGSLHDAIGSSNSQFFDEQFLALVTVGERSGRLADVLKSAATRYQDILTSQLHALTNIFAPLLMIIIGLLIGSIMILIYLPIFSLGNLFGQ